MAKDKSIYIIEEEWAKKRSLEYMKDMKIIMIKGIGYFVVQKNMQVDCETLLNLSTSMESRNINL